MSNHLPITPPPELVEQWFNDSPIDRGLTLATQAARWGADQELEACCEALRVRGAASQMIKYLRETRRPKPPSLKEQALAKTTAILNDPGRALLTEVRETLELNRRALEALDD